MSVCSSFSRLLSDDVFFVDWVSEQRTVASSRSIVILIDGWNNSCCFFLIVILYSVVPLETKKKEVAESSYQAHGHLVPIGCRLIEFRLFFLLGRKIFLVIFFHSFVQIPLKIRFLFRGTWLRQMI